MVENTPVTQDCSFENTSGKYHGKTKVPHLSKKRVKALLSTVANSARKWDPELLMYHAKKIDEGKKHKLVICFYIRIRGK
jgi:hypothetical protein